MFTGIIKEKGTLTDTNMKNGVMQITIRTSWAGELSVDESVAVDGVCLTVVSTDPDAGTFFVQAVEETLSKTTLGEWETGRVVHLERALRMDQGLGGHLVQGHVDTVGHVVSVHEEGENRNVWVKVPEVYSAHLVDRGSITMDGVSLTIARVENPDKFMVTLIPYTWDFTHFNSLQGGESVNLEFDIIGKYVLRFMEQQKG